ncbi:NAD-dependent deacetylase [Promethearchaeum syntrophicum]|uniref:NAD-dependent deacetylase n=1 Tax=Promethearchaeum syntrophicum TaxID=2594042 RepID=A0A5B9DBL7_9ARCH|nr:NAD-dependent protein deacylase [Candidatus Prometheoarchaeum syntrophicum]QEE16534.1 NAD-dependent protein deacylase 2 [Candidatus Prometheoarchaeum syntrophicum]
MSHFFDPQTSLAIDIIKKSKNIVAFTGAGISTESGIADFRSPGGLWSQFDPDKYADYNVFLQNPEFYWKLERTLGKIFQNAKPNKAHKALVKLEKKGKLKAIITQNIDNLHQKAGSKIPIIELHGNARNAKCLDCGQEISRNYINKNLKHSKNIPVCPYCSGRIKTNALLFNEPFPEEIMKKAISLAENCDLMLILGSYLSVFPANQIPLIARKAGASLIFINYEPTHFDKYATLRMLGELGSYLPLIVAGV